MSVPGIGIDELDDIKPNKELYQRGERRFRKSLGFPNLGKLCMLQQSILDPSMLEKKIRFKALVEKKNKKKLPVS
jgi:hypothetical protein